jgi:hypothetical protein
MQLAEGIPGRDVERAFDNRVGGTHEGEVECISIPVRKKREGEKRLGSKLLKDFSFNIDTYLPQYFL